eukprot:11189453-Lingulodinium_polyedra.AAC.1
MLASETLRRKRKPLPGDIPVYFKAWRAARPYEGDSWVGGLSPARTGQSINRSIERSINHGSNQ